ncbi:MAG TPA: ATP-binding protein [Acetomicrobium flavidum]|uniref:Anti-sigma regulatory factor (Ser/Thr protein kinase) n=2 Tax=Acetomicrobium TaxID=49894 RepID=I4BYC2_ACEMN|nr:ATP-binding protein [Acetomicrobium mobile]NLG94412.1 anti-sigma regulatory factor [Acetomicrobium flavidum]AFM22279.1 anti-sigma regulatory factor (Ser/Thr protein kinase) [Acetomicrobium mobile DSM 13181]SIN72138.1 Anti-sigma regulatory factor (Ser/Thr protein kinase) [Acetomicrobium flavidum]HOJ82020.1 ATP-binding protein [Acetomicrobium flavidum]HOM30994.1 ATP-binding protein [Acetomicrobium flavidum]
MSEPLVLELQVKPLDFLAAGETATQFKETLKSLGLAPEICRRAAVVVYEAEMNIVIHGGGGVMRLQVEEDKVTIMAEDEGPGIENLELAMQEGYSSAPDYIREMGFGAGMGLPNIKRNSDELYIDTAPGKGTKLRAVIYLNKGR